MNEDVKSDKISLLTTIKILSPEEIQRLKIEKGDLWYFLVGSRPEGPYCTDDVMNLIREHHEFPIEINISNLENSKWVPLYHTPPFQSFLKSQKRGGKNYSLNDKVYLLVNGQRNGPYGYDNLVQKLNNHQLLLSDLISNDEGKTWGKICEHPFFNRNKRVKEMCQLPDLPEKESFDDSTLETKKEISRLEDQEKNSGMQGLLSLAIIGEKKNDAVFGKVMEESGPVILNDEAPKSTTGTSFIYTLLSGIILFSIGFYYFYPKNDLTHTAGIGKSGDPADENSSSNLEKKFTSKALLPKNKDYVHPSFKDNEDGIQRARQGSNAFTVDTNNSLEELKKDDLRRKQNNLKKLREENSDNQESNSLSSSDDYDQENGPLTEIDEENLEAIKNAQNNSRGRWGPDRNSRRNQSMYATPTKSNEIFTDDNQLESNINPEEDLLDDSASAQNFPSEIDQ